MMQLKHLHSPPLVVLLGLIVSFGLTGCEGDDGAAGADGAPGIAGADGTDGTDGSDGSDGADGISCWDLNQNGVGDLPDEDINGDGVVNVLDCSATTAGAYQGDALHKGFFTDHPYEGTESCMACHSTVGEEIITTGHFTWKGVAANIEGFEGGEHGKIDIINNFCIAVASNEPRCTQCHIGYDYADGSYDFSDRNNVDCLVCHDQTGTYAKAPKTAGNPEPGIDLTAVAQSVAANGGVPTIDNCIDCHAKAGGGDNVKHGDLSMSLANTTVEYDVHMGSADSGGEDFDCVFCHQVQKDAGGNVLSHGIGGMPYHSVEEGKMIQCDGCHDPAVEHAGSPVEGILTSHTRFACQTCHIPMFARNQSTKTEWYWSEAGQDIAPEDIPKILGRDAYDKKKGRFVWENNVRPTMKFFNGKYTKFLAGTNDQYTSLPAVLAEPVGDCSDPESRIYPYKRMIGDQPADLNNQTVLVPNLFPSASQPNAYWKLFDWNLALEAGALAAGQTYTGEFEFVPTVMYLSVNHEIAPKEQALGFGADCGDCHFNAEVVWSELGYTGDPAEGGTCP